MDKTQKPIIRVFNVRHPDLTSPETWELFDRARSGNLSAQRRFARIVLLPMAFFYCSNASRWYKLKKLFDVPTHATLFRLLPEKIDALCKKWFKRPSIIRLQTSSNLSSAVHYFIETLVRNEYRAKFKYSKTFDIVPVLGRPDQDTQARIFLNKDEGEPEEYHVDLDTGQDYEQQPEVKLDRRVLKSLSVGDRALCEGYYRASLLYIQQQAKTLPQKKWKAIPQKDYCESIGVDPTALSRAIRRYKETKAGNYYYLCPNRNFSVGGGSEMAPQTVWHGASVQPCWLHPSEEILVKGKKPWHPSYKVIAVGRSKHYPAGNRKEPWKPDLDSHQGDKRWGWTFHKMQVRVRDSEMMLVHHLDGDCKKQYCRKWGCRYCWAETKKICDDGPAWLSIYSDEIVPAPKPYHEGAILLHNHTQTKFNTIQHINLGGGKTLKEQETPNTLTVRFGRFGYTGTGLLDKRQLGINWSFREAQEAPAKHIEQFTPSLERLIDFSKVHPKESLYPYVQITTSIEKAWLTNRNYARCGEHPLFYEDTCPFCKPLGSAPKTGKALYHLFPTADWKWFYDSPAFAYRVREPGQTHLPRECGRKKSKSEIVPEVVEFREDESDEVIIS